MGAVKHWLQTVACVVLAAAFAYALKHHYSVATSADLLWVLRPTAALVALVLQTPFAFEPEYGFISTRHSFAIEPVCAGVNFMIAAFGTLVLLWVPVLGRLSRKVIALLVAIGVAYLSTLVVNTLRITTAIALGDLGAQVHRIEGIVVYLGGLLLLSAMSSAALRRVQL